MRRGRSFRALAVVGAALIGGIASYSITVAGAFSGSPQLQSDMVGQARPGDCGSPGVNPDLDWYRQRGDTMQSDQLLPSTVSFISPSAGGLPAGGNPCDDGGTETSCLSDLDFDPNDYWVVMDKPEIFDPTAMDLFVAEAGDLAPLTDDAIDTATACDVSIRWAFPGNGESITGLLDFLEQTNPGVDVDVTATGTESMELSVTGMGSDGAIGYFLYAMYLCEGAVALEVSDGTNEYYIVGPPCSFYSLESTLENVAGLSLTYELEDPWSRTLSDTTTISQVGFRNDYVVGLIVKPESPVTITFNAAGTYTVKTGSDPNESCDSLTNVELDGVVKGAASTWTSADPNSAQLFCTTYIPPT